MTCRIFGIRILQNWGSFCDQKTWVSTDWRTIAEVLESYWIKIFVCNDTDKLVWNHIITFLCRRYFLLRKWPVSEMQFSNWKALNIKWFSLFEKSSKTWYYFYLPNTIQCYFVIHIKTAHSMKWLTFLLASLDFTKFL